MTEPALFPNRRRRVRVKGKQANAAQRTLAYLRKGGFQAAVCEKFITRVAGQHQREKFQGGFRQDLFGFMDIIAFHPKTNEVLAIQTTSTRAAIAAHLRLYRNPAGKTERETKKRTATRQAILDWLAQPCRAFLIYGWEPIEGRTKDGRVKVVWELTVRYVTMDDLHAAKEKP